MMATKMDILTGAACVSVVLAMAGATWSSLPIGGAFGWHPILMTLAFPCLMTLGRWTYVSKEIWGTEKTEHRRAHRRMMGLATFMMLLGYVAIFMAHLPTRQFFGYDFIKGQWKPWERIVHVFVGYMAIMLVIVQATIGILKLQMLEGNGTRSYTFHGVLGKAIMFTGAVNILIAVGFFSYSGVQKVVLGFLVIGASAIGICWPTEHKSAGELDSLTANRQDA